jgi:uncharacterized membrane protein YkvA (DUF1232 family)
MPMSVSFELSDRDLERFAARLRELQLRSTPADAEEVLAAAAGLLGRLHDVDMPDFVRQRLAKLGRLVEMVRDPGWQLGAADRERIVAALAYVADPLDLVPDDVPGIGLLDDAVTIELVCLDLAHDLDAYEEFCRYREEERTLRPAAAAPAATSWLAERREELHARARRRRAAFWSADLRS